MAVKSIPNVKAQGGPNATPVKSSTNNLQFKQCSFTIVNLMFSFWTMYLWINVRQYITKKKKQCKGKKITDNVPNQKQWTFRTPICHYNGILLMAWSNKIIIIKIMHRFKWWSCMLLTQYSKKSNTLSQTWCVNCSEKNKNKKARDLRRRHQSFSFLKLETEVSLHLVRGSVS